LARSIAATLYHEDIAHHWQAMQDYNTPELSGNEWEVSELMATLPTEALR
jgi:hypothetical protein